ncbi:MAG: ABC transporter ATP-binding protein [Rhodocyclaceae bacterium]|jgi:ABC-2 type transport system ATP-binding protein|nr:ABC transporter ATP-binding protein [Rhodocyclaceae bacterium]MBK6906773.1 ABC transporter ATP-binding protein [Rhodocyclaceae bacterium]
MTAAIDIVSLCKDYPRTLSSPKCHAVRDISLSISPGEVFGFIGPNGAGKSTTIKILIGAMTATTGRAELFGVDVREPEARRGLGYVPENSGLPEYLTPREVLYTGLRLHKCAVPSVDKHVMYWLDRFGLAHVARKPIRGFSKGMAQRTALAHAFSVKPRLLILDEPLSGLDPVGRKDVVDILSEYRQQGGTVFFTSHVLHDVERVADRFGFIHEGVLQTVQSPAELFDGEQMVTVRTIGIEAPAGFVRETSGRWVGEVSRENLWPTIDALREAGHQISEIKPTLNLESAFFRFLGKSH